MTPAPIIRFALKKDLDELIVLCEKHAIYEQATYSRIGKREKLEQSIFGEHPALYCLVVDSKKGLIGYATYMKQFSTWDASFYIYMDCLFMREGTRGFGIGDQLMQRIKLEAAQLDCKLIQWQTPDFNVRAIKFYKRIGATSKEKERFFWEV